MATLVLTVIGDEQAGLVDALSGVVAARGGNWEKSQMAQLGGKFAGIVMVTVADNAADALIADLQPLEEQGLLDITIERAGAASTPPGSRLTLQLMGQDHPGIVHDISHTLASRGVSIAELHTWTSAAPMAGGTLFEARAVLEVPAEVSETDLREPLESLANELMVDIELSSD